MLNKLIIRKGDFYLPNKSIDLQKWATVACDQYSSQKEYWETVDKIVGDSPSTLRMIIPECYLDEMSTRTTQIHNTMDEYLKSGVFASPFSGMILICRETSTGIRTGLLCTVDLEGYNYSPDSKSEIRPTEGTIAARIPARLGVRQSATLEFSHVLMLLDDKKDLLFSSLRDKLDSLDLLYNFNLMQNGGNIKGYSVSKDSDLEEIDDILETLFSNKKDGDILLASGDGNHSLATAKAHWEQVKGTLNKSELDSHPARYATVEVMNLYENSLVFEPIHMVVFDKSVDEVIELLGDATPVVDNTTPDIILVHNGEDLPLKFKTPKHDLPIGTIQTLFDSVDGLIEDHVHGEVSVRKLVKEHNAVGILLPALDKNILFSVVEHNGPLPRKTFSMGEADEKRYYIEGRRIK